MEDSAYNLKIFEETINASKPSPEHEIVHGPNRGEKGYVPCRVRSVISTETFRGRDQLTAVTEIMELFNMILASPECEEDIKQVNKLEKFHHIFGNHPVATFVLVVKVENGQPNTITYEKLIKSENKWNFVFVHPDQSGLMQKYIPGEAAPFLKHALTCVYFLK
jgi:hypothetical protein